MDETFRDIVTRTLREPMERHGLRVTDDQHSPQDFGNAIVILESRGVLRLRVVRDRGQVFVDFGSSVDPGSWLDGNFVLDHVLGSGRSRIDDPPRGISLEAFGELLGTHFERIEKAFRRSTYMDTRSAVRRLSDQWMLRTLGRPIPKDR